MPDRQAIARALYEALTPDPFYREMETLAEGDPVAGMLAYYEVSMREAEAFGHATLVDDPWVGAAIWSVPLPAVQANEKSAAKAAAVEAALGSKALEAYTQIGANMAAGTTEVIGTTDWYLSIAGIAPADQGKGHGADLLAPVLEKADAAGVATYLETFTPGNHAFYERLGYRSVGAFDEPWTASRYTVMRRLPR